MKSNKITFIMFFGFIFLLINGLGNIAQAQESPEGTLAIHQTDPELSRFDHLISGYAFRVPDSIPFEGLILSYSGVGDAVVNADGSYTMYVPRHWSGTVTPHLCEGGFYSFDPPQIEYEDVIFDFDEQNFSGEADTSFIISGTFTDKFTGLPMANTEILFKTTSGTKQNSFWVTTNELGEYSIERLPCWNNVLDPKLTGFYYFEPLSRSYSDLSSDMENQDYMVIDYGYPIPPDWETINTGSFAIIAVETTSNPNICGLPLEIGDLIGVFYYDDNDELKCGGFGRWQDESNVAVMAQGDDNTTSIKDGFSTGEVFNWRVYSYAHQDDYPAEIELRLGFNKWYSLGTSIATDVDAGFENEIVIPQGWSGISSYTKPDKIILTTLMSPIANELIILQDMTKMYYPAAGINTMFIWSSDKGYRIKVSEETTLPMNGCPEEDKSVDLDATWNILPVLSSCDVSTADIFSPILEDVLIVKEIAGTHVYWPSMGVETLETLEAGRAYYVAVSQNTSISYGDCDAAKGSASKQKLQEVNQTSWESPAKTASTHTVALSGEALAGLSVGDYVGAFTEMGICAGLVQITDLNKNIALTLFGDDGSTSERDGFEVGELISYKVFKIESGEEIKLFADYDPTMPVIDGSFADNGLSLVDNLILSSTGIEGLSSSVRMFPNPSNGSVEVSIGRMNAFRITIQNISGQILLDENAMGTARLDLSGYSKGVYIVKMEGDSFANIQKLVLK